MKHGNLDVVNMPKRAFFSFFPVKHPDGRFILAVSVGSDGRDASGNPDPSFALGVGRIFPINPKLSDDAVNALLDTAQPIMSRIRQGYVTEPSASHGLGRLDDSALAAIPDLEAVCREFGPDCDPQYLVDIREPYERPGGRQPQSSSIGLNV